MFSGAGIAAYVKQLDASKSGLAEMANTYGYDESDLLDEMEATFAALKQAYPSGTSFCGWVHCGSLCSMAHKPSNAAAACDYSWLHLDGCVCLVRFGAYFGFVVGLLHRALSSLLEILYWVVLYVDGLLEILVLGSPIC